MIDTPAFLVMPSSLFFSFERACHDFTGSCENLTLTVDTAECQLADLGVRIRYSRAGPYIVAPVGLNPRRKNRGSIGCTGVPLTTIRRPLCRIFRNTCPSSIARSRCKTD